MPQGSTTYTMLTAPPHEQDVYTEVWISYRDIFGKAWVLGVGGTYRWKTDSFIPDFNYFNQSMGFTNTPDRSYFKMDFSSPEIPPPH